MNIYTLEVFLIAGPVDRKFALRVRTIAKRLDSSARLTLQCYYSAAVWLGEKYQPHKTLPDYFSQKLNLHPVDDPE